MFNINHVLHRQSATMFQSWSQYFVVFSCFRLTLTLRKPVPALREVTTATGSTASVAWRTRELWAPWWKNIFTSFANMFHHKIMVYYFVYNNVYDAHYCPDIFVYHKYCSYLCIIFIFKRFTQKCMFMMLKFKLFKIHFHFNSILILM